MNKRNGYVDLFKLIMSYLVITLHFSYHPITRIAVPFFFMISGYYAYSDNSDATYRFKKAKRQLFNSLKYLIFGLTVYFIYDMIMIFFNHYPIMNYLKDSIYKNPIIDIFILNKPSTTGYHLWFLLALLTVNIIHYFLIKYNKTQIYKYICIPFLLINLTISIYLSPSVVGRVWDLEYTRNAILFGLPLFGIGYIISSVNLKKLQPINLIIFIAAILFAVLQTFENVLYIRLFKVEGEFFISSVIGSALFVVFFKNLRHKGEWFYKITDEKISFFVYIVHLIIASLLQRCFGIDSWLLTLSTIVVSTLLYCVIRYSISLARKINSYKNR